MTYPGGYGATYVNAPGVTSGNEFVIPPGVTWAGQNGATVTTLAPWQQDLKGAPLTCPWFVAFNGFIERLPQSWDDLLRGMVDATIVDAWAGVNYNPPPILFTEILNDSPYAYWPCNDPAGAITASNLAPGNDNPLQLTQSKYGPGPGTSQAFGASPATQLLGAQGTILLTSSGGFRASGQNGMWSQTVGGSATASEGYTLTGTDPGFPRVTTGITIEGWFEITADGTGINNLFYLSTSGKGFFQLAAQTSGSTVNQLVFYYNGDNGVLYSATISGYATIPLGAPLHVVITTTNTGAEFYVNGIDQGPLTFTYPLLCPSFSEVAFSGPGNTVGNIYAAEHGYEPIPGFTGTTGHLAIYGYRLSSQRVYTHWLAGSTGLAGEPSTYRIERLLQAGNATFRRAIVPEVTSPTNVVSCQDIPGNPVAQSVSNITGDLVPGVFYVAPTGDMVMRPRENSYNQPPLWTLGENVANGEIPYLPDITFDFDPSRVINEIQISQLDNQDIITPSVTAVETASQVLYGTISDQATGYLEGDLLVGPSYGPGLLDLANWLACVYQSPVLRLSAVTVAASAYPAAWPFVLGAAVGDPVQVNRRPLGSPPGTVVSVIGRISQTNRTFSFGTGGVTAQVSCIIDPMPEANILTCDSPTLGLLNGENVLSW